MTERDTPAAPSPSDVFERIQRRRASAAAAAQTGAESAVATSPQSAPATPSSGNSTGPETGMNALGPTASQALRIDDLLNDAPRSTTTAAADRFPRSRTMRLILAHPGLALAIGLPIVGLVAASPAARRVVGAAVRIGVQPEVRQLIRFSVAALGSDKRETAAGKKTAP